MGQSGGRWSGRSRGRRLLGLLRGSLRGLRLLGLRILGRVRVAQQLDQTVDLHLLLRLLGGRSARIMAMEAG